jgi:hypothetical protein
MEVLQADQEHSRAGQRPEQPQHRLAAHGRDDLRHCRRRPGGITGWQRDHVPQRRRPRPPSIAGQFPDPQRMQQGLAQRAQWRNRTRHDRTARDSQSSTGPRHLSQLTQQTRLADACLPGQDDDATPRRLGFRQRGPERLQLRTATDHHRAPHRLHAASLLPDP